ncbi:MAG: cytochrome b/b6 domain-containing protein [Gammaproteobacteria bacterium]
MVQAKWSAQTRWLHMGLAVTVTLQLAISLIMEPPDEESASAMARAAFEAHEAVGLAAVIVVLAHWLWSLSSRRDGGLAHLFPWSGAAWAEVKADVSKLMSRQLPDGGSRGGLPGLVHGLGFLAVTGMALTGAVLFVVFPESGKPDDTVEFIADVHSFIANFVWAYWGGHVALAFLHKQAGHSTVQDMFSLKP